MIDLIGHALLQAGNHLNNMNTAPPKEAVLNLHQAFALSSISPRTTPEAQWNFGQKLRYVAERWASSI
jgi:hypothetical protein